MDESEGNRWGLCRRVTGHRSTRSGNACFIDRYFKCGQRSDRRHNYVHLPERSQVRSAWGMPGIVPISFRTHVMTASLRCCEHKRRRRFYTGIRKSDALAEQQDKTEDRDRQSTCLSASKHGSHGGCVVYPAFDLDQPDAPDPPPSAHNALLCSMPDEFPITCLLTRKTPAGLQAGVPNEAQRYRSPVYKPLPLCGES